MHLKRLTSNYQNSNNDITGKTRQSGKETKRESHEKCIAISNLLGLIGFIGRRPTDCYCLV